MAGRPWTTFDVVVVRVETNEEMYGWGEAWGHAGAHSNANGVSLAVGENAGGFFGYRNLAQAIDFVQPVVGKAGFGEVARTFPLARPPARRCARKARRSGRHS